MKVSDYTARGYACLHIKNETRTRLNLAKAHMQARQGRVVTQSEIIDHLLDKFTNVQPIESLEADSEPVR